MVTRGDLERHLTYFCPLLRFRNQFLPTIPTFAVRETDVSLVGLPRDQNKANFDKLRQIAKFGMIVYYKIVINNLI